MTCWLALQQAELTLVQHKISSSTHAEFLDKRVDRAQRRYLQAIKTLAQVRRLLRPSVQVNIAEQQVNVGG
ncbi:hypothetical protein ACFL6C_11830 [Myxococcota bacterium]